MAFPRFRTVGSVDFSGADSIGGRPVGRRGESFASNDVSELSRYYPDFEITISPQSNDIHFKNTNTGKTFEFSKLDLVDNNKEFIEKIEEARKLETPLFVRDLMPELKKATPEEIKEKLKKKKKDEHFSEGMSLASQRWFPLDRLDDLAAMQRMTAQRQIEEQRQQRGLGGGLFGSIF